MSSGQPITHADLLSLLSGRHLVASHGEYPQILAPTDYPLVVPADDSASTTLTISGGNLWVLESLRAKAEGAFLAMIRDASSDVALMNKPIHSDDLFGTAQRPGFISERGWAVEPNQGVRQFSIELTDLTGASNTVYLEFVGHRRRTQRLDGRTGGAG